MIPNCFSFLFIICRVEETVVIEAMISSNIGTDRLPFLGGAGWRGVVQWCYRVLH